MQLHARATLPSTVPNIIGLISGSLTLAKTPRDRQLPKPLHGPYRISQGLQQAHSNQVHEFVDALVEGKTPPYTGDNGRRDIKTIMAVLTTIPRPPRGPCPEFTSTTTRDVAVLVGVRSVGMSASGGKRTGRFWAASHESCPLLGQRTAAATRPRFGRSKEHNRPLDGAK